MKKNKLIKKSKYIILLFIIMICLVVTKIYAKYTSLINVSVTTTSGNLICDAVVDNPGTYFTTDGTPYFTVQVTNYANNARTTVPLQYQLTISDNSGSNGLYRINTNLASLTGTFSDSVQTATSSFGNSTNQSTTYYVEALTTDKSIQNLSFSVNLSCSQVGA